MSGVPDSAGHKGFTRGTHRTVAPGETLARVRPLMAAMGITRIANVTGLDRVGLPVVMVTRPNARSVAVSQGKGLDLDAAMASGLMEAVEGYHAERIDHPLKYGSRADLAADHRLIKVEGLPQIAGGRYHDALPMLWIAGRDLVSDQALWLPYEVVHANYTLPLPSGSGCFVAGTNGLASGNHRLEAICHGITEVIERDSTALWNQLDLQRQAATRVELASVSEPACRTVLDQLAQAELGVAVWETTSDIGVPSFIAMLVDERPGSHLGVGAGCHPARAVALLRALTEAVQVRTTYITGARDDLSPDHYSAAGVVAKQDGARALMALPGPRRAFTTGPDFVSATFEADLDWLLGRLRTVGLDQAVAIDLTRTDFQLPVVRVVVPGLEGPDDDESYLPGPRARALQGDGQ